MRRDTHVLESLKVESYAKTFEHTVFIDEEVADTSYYRSVLSTLNSAGENDIVRMIISTDGGVLNTASNITHAMDVCKGTIVAVLASNVISAGTAIALHADSWEVGAGCSWMTHTASFGIGGSAEKVREHYKHEEKLIEEWLFREYLGFYSESEIIEIANGKESFLLADEVRERLQNFAEYRKIKEEEYYDKQDEALWQENNLMVAESLSSLNISQEDKDTFNRVKDLLDESMQQEDDSFEEDDKAVVEKNVISYNWCNGITVDATDYPDQSLYLSCDEEGVELLLKLDTMLADRETVIYFLEEITGDKVSRKKVTKVLSLELIALAVKFVLEVQNK